MDPFQIGEVVEVRGTRIKIQVDYSMNHSSFIYSGQIINNITVNAFIIIRQGIISIVGKIDAEYIEDLQNSKKIFEKDDRYSKGTIKRMLEVQIVGFIDSKFNNGIKKLPMIGNKAFIPSNKEIAEIYSGNSIEESGSKTIRIGTTVFENIPIDLPINSLFASHIGVFGNTGSGKSNTLSRIYQELFSNLHFEKLKEKSLFCIIDFNGEYTKSNMFGVNSSFKKVLELSTRAENCDKLEIKEEILYNPEILTILFNATEQTQKPFINRVVKGMKWAEENGFELKTWAPKLYYKILTSVSPSKEAFDLFKETISEIFTFSQSKEFLEKLNRIAWHAMQQKLYIDGTRDYFNGGELDEDLYLRTGIDECNQLMSNLQDKNAFEVLIFRFRLQLVSDLLKKHAQFEHINPLINRAKSRTADLGRVIKLVKEQPRFDNKKFLNIISLRSCNVEIKKIIPLLIAKMIFEEHKKSTNQLSIDKTVHLIIDEAHNILSEQSGREAEEWKDYRLDLFEEIIKEGRKFGFFLTIASQRPADISPTIISQIHNFFIHRLVNNKDLELLENTISTLDRVSKMSIPMLSSGSCIITGTALVMPIFAKVNFIEERELRPSSDNIDLVELWTTQPKVTRKKIPRALRK